MTSCDIVMKTQPDGIKEIAMGTSANNQSAKTINLIDCDVHHSTSKQDDLFPYLPRHYVEYIKDFGTMMPGVGYTNMPKGGVRAELWEGQDKHPGSNIELAREIAVKVARRHVAVAGDFGHRGLGVTVMEKPLQRRVQYLFAHGLLAQHALNIGRFL